MEKQQMKREIAEAFEFLRFVVKNPRVLRKIKDGSEIRLVPSAVAARNRPYRLPKGAQTFIAETTFRRV